jgi:polyphosphate kinase
MLGPFLEHSRLFRFGSEARGFDYLAGSADLMPRNLDRRVEVLISIDDPGHRKRVDEILSLHLTSDRMAWELHDSEWHRVATGAGVSVQDELMRSARRRAETDSPI